MEQPIAVCSDPDCCEKKSCDNTIKIHYKSVCHKPCYLEKSDGNIIGNSGLLDCHGQGNWYDHQDFAPDSEKLVCNKDGQAFGCKCVQTKSETCFQCSHSYQHLTINYETKTETKQIRKENNFERIETSYCDIDKILYQIEKIKAKVDKIKQ